MLSNSAAPYPPISHMADHMTHTIFLLAFSHSLPQISTDGMQVRLGRVDIMPTAVVLVMPKSATIAEITGDAICV